MRSITNFRFVRYTLASTLLFLQACSGGGSDSSIYDQELRAFIEQHQLSGDPARGRDIPDIQSPLAQLGKKLFFSKTLGGDFDSACVSCHHPMLGGGDNLSLSIGVGAEDPDLLGPGRKHPDGEFTVPRNAPTTFNIALWDRTLFWDGRAQSLGGTPLANGADSSGIRTPDSKPGVSDPAAGHNLPTAQARFPVTSAEEMRGFSFVAGGNNAELRTALEKRLSESGSWPQEFEKTFGDAEIRFDRIAAAIAEYERSQTFVNNAWKRYVEGDNLALSASAKRGALLFFRSKDQGGAQCAACHSGDTFTNEQFYGLAVPQIGPGKGNGENGTQDFGCERETKDLNDRYTFRVPGLLNVAVTGPYTHAGAYLTLEQVVRHHLNPVQESAGFDPQSIPQANSDYWQENTEIALLQLLESNRSISTLTEPIELSDQEIKDLVSFLEEGLTDPCVLSRECLSPWILDSNDLDPDGNMLIARDKNGELL